MKVNSHWIYLQNGSNQQAWERSSLFVGISFWVPWRFQKVPCVSVHQRVVIWWLPVAYWDDGQMFMLTGLGPLYHCTVLCFGLGGPCRRRKMDRKWKGKVPNISNMLVSLPNWNINRICFIKIWDIYLRIRNNYKPKYLYKARMPLALPLWAICYT